MSFFRTLIYFILGDLGRALLQFYQQNDIWINSLALIYGLILIYAHRNLRQVIHQIEADILQIAGELDATVKLSEVSAQLKRRWQERYSDQKTYIPTRTDLWLHHIAKADILELLHIDADYVKMVLHKLTGSPDRKSFTLNKYRVWDEYRHRLLTGIRSRIKDPQEILEQLEAQDKRAKASRR